MLDTSDEMGDDEEGMEMDADNIDDMGDDDDTIDLTDEDDDDDDASTASACVPMRRMGAVPARLRMFSA